MHRTNLLCKQTNTHQTLELMGERIPWFSATWYLKYWSLKALYG